METRPLIDGIGAAGRHARISRRRAADKSQRIERQVDGGSHHIAWV